MQALRQLGGGVIIAIISIVLVLGGISLSLAESAPVLVLETPTPIPSLAQFFMTPLTTPSIGISTETATITATLAIAPTQPPAQPTICTPPGGWVQIIVGAGDTIYSLAQRYKTSEDALKNGNCLTSVELQAGSVLYVPFVPTVVMLPCSPPATWVKTYIVQPGENLFRIALSYGLPYQQLQQGNCMGSSTTIYSGQRLWVPNRPTLTPRPGATITLVFPSSTASITSMPPTATPQPSATSTFISTASFSPTASFTSVPPPGATQTPSITPFP
jgi:LysM repeat protein